MGYDVAQVDQVVEQLDAMVRDQGKQVSSMQRQIDEQACELKRLKKRIADYEEKEMAIAKVMVNAEKIAMRMVSGAQSDRT